MRKVGLTKKFDRRSDYVSDLKLLIMDEVFFVYVKVQNAMQIIAEWFELNEHCSPEAWSRMDSFSIRNIWEMMINRRLIEQPKK